MHNTAPIRTEDLYRMAWQQTVEQTVTGLGFDLVDLERSAGGLLRVTIDWPWQPQRLSKLPQSGL